MQHIPSVHVAHGSRELRCPRDHDGTVIAPAFLTLAADVVVECAASGILEEEAEGGIPTPMHERSEEAHDMRVAHCRTVAHLWGTSEAVTYSSMIASTSRKLYRTSSK